MYILTFDTANRICSAALFYNGKKIGYYEERKPSEQSKNIAIFAQKLIENENISFQDIKYIITTNGPGSFTGTRIGLAFLKGLMLSLNAKIVILSTIEAILYGYLYNYSYKLIPPNKEEMLKEKKLNSSDIFKFEENLIPNHINVNKCENINNKTLDNILIVQNASRSQIYMQHFSYNKKISEIELLQITEFKKKIGEFTREKNKLLILGSAAKLLGLENNMILGDEEYIDQDAPTAINIAEAFYYLMQNNMINNFEVTNVKPLYLRPAI